MLNDRSWAGSGRHLHVTPSTALGVHWFAHWRVAEAVLRLGTKLRHVRSEAPYEQRLDSILGVRDR